MILESGLLFLGHPVHFTVNSHRSSIMLIRLGHGNLGDRENVKHMIYTYKMNAQVNQHINIG